MYPKLSFDEFYKTFTATSVSSATLSPCDCYEDVSFKQLIQLLENMSPSIVELTLYNLNRWPMIKLESVLNALPKTVKSLDLRQNALGQKEKIDFIQVMRALPPWLNTLILSSNELFNLSEDCLIAGLSLIPKSVKTLKLDNNRLDMLPRGRLTYVFEAIPKTVRHLSLQENCLGYCFRDELREALSKLQVSVLDLSHNGLSSVFRRGKLSVIFKGISKSVTHLILRDNDLGYIECEDLAEAMAAIPHSVVKLSLENNRLKKLPNRGLILLFKALPRLLQTLELRNNGLGFFDAGVLHEALRSLPNTLTSLNLSMNELYRLNTGATCALRYAIGDLPYFWLQIQRRKIRGGGQYLAWIFQAIPPSVLNLNLSSNRLLITEDESMIDAFHHLPRTIQTLDFSDNFFSIFDLENLEVFKQILSAMPRSITMIKLSGNRLHKIGTVKEVADALVKTGKQIQLGDDEYEIKLKKYMKETPRLTLLFGASRFSRCNQPRFESFPYFFTKADKDSVLRKYFGAGDGSKAKGKPNHPLGEIQLIREVCRFLPGGQY